MSRKEQLSEGDRILDAHGNFIIEHHEDQRLVREADPADLARWLLEGEITPDEFADMTVGSGHDIRDAYYNDEELPEGAIVMPDPERATGHWR